MPKAKPVEGWALNGNIRIHYIDSNPVPSQKLTPLVYIPGALNGADGLLPEMAAFAPRRCVSMALRGRGRSDSPKSGYSFQENVSDVETVVDTLRLKSFCLMGWSLGVPHAIRYASRNPDRVRGLILLDYPARYPRYNIDWAEATLSNPTFRTLAPEHAVRGLQADSEETVLWDELRTIRVPVLVIGGGIPNTKANPSGSLLKQDHVDLYEENLDDVQTIIFEDSGHNVSQPDFERFIGALTDFLERLDDLQREEAKR